MLILISALHVCIFALAVIMIHIGSRDVGLPEVETPKLTVSVEKATQPETEAESEVVTETVEATEAIETTETIEATESTETTETTESELETTEIEQESEVVSEVETEPEVQALYSFLSTNELHNLNIRQNPNVNSPIIGKVTPNSTGDVISIVDDDWALIEYNGLQGYCSREYLYLEEK
jgi:hypothetical protein